MRVCAGRLTQAQVLLVVVHGPNTGAPLGHETVRFCVIAPVWPDGQAYVLVSVPGWQTHAARSVVLLVTPAGHTRVVVVVVLPE